MNPDMTAIAAFQAKEAEYAQRVNDLEAATAERDNVRPAGRIWHAYRLVMHVYNKQILHAGLQQQPKPVMFALPDRNNRSCFSMYF